MKDDVHAPTITAGRRARIVPSYHAGDAENARPAC